MLFRSEEDIATWCREQRLCRGQTLDLNQTWGLARAWYRDRLSADWRRKTVDEIEQVFGGLDMVGSFWSLRSETAPDSGT